ncbi:MAG: DsrE family protein [Burkholderiales bacterium]
MKQKHAFVVYSGAGDTGKAFHALIHAKQAHRRGDEVELYFAGEGTVWPEKLADAGHPMHGLFMEVRDAGAIAGACRNCAVAFGHEPGAQAACGLVQGPEQSFGQIDILGKSDAGFRVWLF